MTKRFRFLTSLVIIALFCSCTKKPSSGADYMVLDEIVYVDQFPETVVLKDPVPVDPGVVGATKFILLDSLVVFSTNNPDGMWAFFSFPDFQPRGSYIIKGNGPQEFLNSPWVGTKNVFYEKNGGLFAGIYDNAKGRVFEMNVGKTLEDNKLSMELVRDSLPPYLFDFTIINSTTFFCREISYDDTKLERFILKNRERSIPPVLEKLNKAAIRNGEDYNILGTITKYNAKTGRLIEMPMDLNYVNIYTLDGSFGKTICIGRKLDNISDIQNQRKPVRIYRHGSMRDYDDMFGILAFNEEWGAFERERKKLPSVQLFNIDGEPLIEFKLKHFATSFDIDFDGGNLYTYDFKTEEFYKYKISL